jgi:predicted transposase YdaD
VALHWQYQPIRLWEIPAENLLQLEQPALAALVGLTQLRQPEQVLPQALARIRSLEDVAQRQRLLTAMVTLLPTEEVTQMVEKLLEESETLLIDTPYLRRMREKGRVEGREEGRVEGREEGIQEGVQIGREKGREEGLREAILEAVVHRFNPPAAEYRELQRHLEAIHQPDALQKILLALFDAADTATILVLAAEANNLSDSPSG